MRRGPERSSQLSLSAPDSLGLYYRAVEDGDLPPLPMPWISPPSRFLGAKGATRPRPVPGGSFEHFSASSWPGQAATAAGRSTAGPARVLGIRRADGGTVRGADRIGTGPP